MSTPVTVVYLTHRADPRFEWFADGLARQSAGADVAVVIVDGRHSAERGAMFDAAARGRFPLRHVAAKPTPYAGPHRRTGRDYFSAASARNTGILYASSPYVVCVDDLSVLMPGWWAEVLAAARAGIVVAGAYQKRWDMVVEDGCLVSSRSETSGVDSRWSLGSERGLVRIGGGQLFGCSFGAPRELLLSVNGFDELCDTIGGEDWHLGLRLEWSGAPIHYNRRMLTVESEELHRVGEPALRIDKTAAPTAYMRRLRAFGVGSRHLVGRWDSSHMILDLLHGTRSVQTLGNYYLLATLTAEGLAATVARFPRSHWFDEQALATL